MGARFLPKRGEVWCGIYYNKVYPTGIQELLALGGDLLWSMNTSINSLRWAMWCDGELLWYSLRVCIYECYESFAVNVWAKPSFNTMSASSNSPSTITSPPEIHRTTIRPPVGPWPATRSDSFFPNQRETQDRVSMSTGDITAWRPHVANGD